MLFASAVVELPSYVATTYLMDRLGRRTVISTFMVMGGLACIVSAYIPTSEDIFNYLLPLTNMVDWTHNGIGL